MASKATQKGNRGQRKAIDLIEKWTHRKFKSSSQSGMSGWNHDPHVGDILCKTEGHYFPFCVEVKNYRDINFCQLLQPDKKIVTILDFWKQVAADAINVKKVPILLMRFNGLPADFFFVVITLSFFGEIENEIPKGKVLFFEDETYNLAISQSTSFFDSNYKKVKLLAKAHKKSLYA